MNIYYQIEPEYIRYFDHHILPLLKGRGYLMNAIEDLHQAPDGSSGACAFLMPLSRCEELGVFYREAVTAGIGYVIAYGSAFSPEDECMCAERFWRVLRLPLPFSQATGRYAPELLLHRIEESRTLAMMRPGTDVNRNLVAQTAFEELPLPLVIVELVSEESIYLNAEARKLIGCAAITFSAIFEKPEVADEISSALSDNRLTCGMDVRVKSVSGTIFEMMLAASIITIGQRSLVVLVFTDVSDRRAAEDQLRQMHNILEAGMDRSGQELLRQSMTDSFTGLPNRNQLTFDLQRNPPQCLMLITIDSYSKIVSAYGISAASAVVMHAAQTLNEAAQTASALLYRTGNDELVMVFPLFAGMPLARGQEFADLVRQSPASYQETDITVTISIGIVFQKQEALLQKATVARELAQSRGPGNAAVYEENLQQEAQLRENLQWLRLLSLTLRQGGIVPYYQGIRNNQTGVISKYESLARLFHEDN